MIEVMRERGTYGRTFLGADPSDSTSSPLGALLLVGLFAGGALWGRHQAQQATRQYREVKRASESTADLPTIPREALRGVRSTR